METMVGHWSLGKLFFGRQTLFWPWQRQEKPQCHTSSTSPNSLSHLIVLKVQVIRVRIANTLLFKSFFHGVTATLMKVKSRHKEWKESSEGGWPEHVVEIAPSLWTERNMNGRSERQIILGKTVVRCPHRDSFHLTSIYTATRGFMRSWKNLKHYPNSYFISRWSSWRS